jgi:hypothetical protein
VPQDRVLSVARRRRYVAELTEKPRQLLAAAMDVPDDVEGTVLVLEVVPERLPFDSGPVDFLGRGEDEDVPESLVLQVSERAAQGLRVLPRHVRSEWPLGPVLVSVVAQSLRQVQYDGHGQAVVLPGQGHNRLPGLGLDVRCVDDGELSGRQALAGDVVQNVEGVVRGRLAVLVVRDEPAAVIRRENLRRLEVLTGERGLSRARGPDQRDKGQLWNRDLHAVFISSRALSS